MSGPLTTIYGRGVIFAPERITLRAMTTAGAVWWEECAPDAPQAEVYVLEAAGQWRPIGTAPKDGTWVIAAFLKDARVYWVSNAQWTGQWSTPRWWDGGDPCGLAGPTHWMPYPAPAMEVT